MIKLNVDIFLNLAIFAVGVLWGLIVGVLAVKSQLPKDTD